LKAFHHIVASSAETIGAFNTGFDTVNLHRLTRNSAAASHTAESSAASAAMVKRRK
jgi:hypothetical protein